MSLVHVFGLVVNAPREWRSIHDKRYTARRSLLAHTVLFALLPTVAGYLGATEIGWRIGAGDIVRITESSGLRIAVLYYFALVCATLSVGAVTRWMSVTYGADQPFGQCFTLATYSATPLFVVGLLQLYPVLWLNLLAGLPALGFSVYLFYSGVPVMMEVPPERGFLFATAVMGFGLVALVAMLVITVLLWGFGLGPVYIA